MAARLDAIDRQILKELQEDGRITNVELARRVGISAPPCLRRVRALEQAGYIKGYRALLDEKLLGYEVTVFAMVHLTSQADADLRSFEDFVRAQPLVRECWMLSGEIDFILKCVAPDLNAQFHGCRDGADGPQDALMNAARASRLSESRRTNKVANSLCRVGARAHEARHHLARKQLERAQRFCERHVAESQP